MTLRQVSRFTAAVFAGAALLMPARAAAQGITAGIKAGLNNSNISLDFPGDDTGAPTPKSRNGLIIGGFVGKDFNPKGGILVEVLYAQAGTKLSFTEEDGTAINQEIKVDYIQIPVLGRVNFKASNAAVVHIFGGPAFAFKASQSEKLTINGIEVTVDPADEANIKDTDMGLTVGAGLDIGRLLIDVRYTWGLMNINNDTGTNEPDVKTKQFAVMFGIDFGKK
jgi:outer membrane protein with beta-barrel domain